MLERGLREYNICERDVKIKTGENGKPYLEEYPEIHFNLSHSGNMVFAVFSDREVGCDIEEIGKPQEKLAERFFCPEEYEHLMKIEDEHKRCEEFYRLWTLKESFMKVTGLGMKLPLDSFCFQLGERVEIRQHINKEEYDFQELEITDKKGTKYKAAICLCVKK